MIRTEQESLPAAKFPVEDTGYKLTDHNMKSWVEIVKAFCSLRKPSDFDRKAEVDVRYKLSLVISKMAPTEILKVNDIVTAVKQDLDKHQEV